MITVLNAADIILILAMLALLSSLAGLLFRRLNIPQVVGYIVTGIIIGQSGLRIFSADVITALGPVNSLALSLIGFLIGAELKTTVIKKYGKQFVSILLFESITPFIIVSIVTGIICWLFTKNIRESLATALILGAISAATAPAATTDVLKENRARGPLTTTVLGIVAMDDAAALLFYAITASIARPLLAGGGTGAAAAAAVGTVTVAGTAAALEVVIRIARIFAEIALSIVLGGICGIAILHLARLSKTDEGRMLTVTLGLLLLSSALSSLFGLDTILAAMTAGFVLANAPQGKSKTIFTLTEKYTPPIYALFFTLVGARLNIWSVTPAIGLVALGYVAARTIGKTIGASAGAALSGAPSGVRRYLPFCLLSQAGVAIGLSLAAGSDFADTIGANVMLTITATTFIAQLAGPVCVKYGVNKAGECGLDITPEDLMKECTIADVTAQGEPIASESSCAITGENDTVRSIIGAFSSHGNLNYAVRDKDGRLTGIISVEHLKSALYLTEILDSLVACDIMDAPQKTVTPEDSLAAVLAAFDEYDTNAFPIVSADGSAHDKASGVAVGVALGIAERSAIDHYIHERVLSAHISSERLNAAL